MSTTIIFLIRLLLVLSAAGSTSAFLPLQLVRTARQSSFLLSSSENNDWNDQYQLYVNYTLATGEVNVPLNHSILGNWVRNQRLHYKKWQTGSSSGESTILTPHRHALLERAGFVFSVNAHEWMLTYNKLHIFREEHGHCRVPSGTPLGIWVKNQRMQFKKKTLSNERLVLLQDIDFCWNPAEWTYRNYVRQILLDEKASIWDWKVTDGPLGLWMSRQRTLYKKYCRNDDNEQQQQQQQADGGQSLQAYQIELLETELGFDCDSMTNDFIQAPLVVDWSDRMRQLQEFQEEHGHLNVPRTYTKHANLGSWVSKVRERYRFATSEKTQQRLEDLHDIGFIWDVLEYKWQQKFQLLIDFYEQHGHVHVPDSLGGLGPWVRDQRREYQKIRRGDPSRLTPNHARALNRIGIDWNRQRTVREKQDDIFRKRLQQWQDHCHEIEEDDDDDDNNMLSTQLRHWVEKQRKLYRKWLQGEHDMDEERRQMLEDAGIARGIQSSSVATTAAALVEEP